MINIFIIILVVLSFSAGFFLSYTNNPQKIVSEPLDKIERTRKIAREKGLVLHMDSYYNGVELYVPKSHENLPYEKVKYMGLRI